MEIILLCANCLCESVIEKKYLMQANNNVGTRHIIHRIFAGFLNKI